MLVSQFWKMAFGIFSLFPKRFVSLSPARGSASASGHHGVDPAAEWAAWGRAKRLG